MFLNLSLLANEVQENIFNRSFANTTSLESFANTSKEAVLKNKDKHNDESESIIG